MRRILTGLALASFMMLGISTVAHAGPGCMIPPPDMGGNISIVATGGDCTLGNVTASGAVSIDLQGAGNLTVGNISAGLGVTIYTAGGNESVGSVSAGTIVLAEPGSASFTASGDITGPQYVSLSGTTVSSSGKITSSAGYVSLGASQGAVNVTGAVSGAASANSVTINAFAGITTGAITGPVVYVSAYTSGTTGNLTIGSGGISSITSTAPTGGNVSVNNGVSTNGPGSGPNNITVISTGALQISHSASGGGSLFMLAAGGAITLPAGEQLVVDGPNASIFLQSKTLATSGATTLSGSLASGNAYHRVSINADNVNYQGNLTILANGNGASSSSEGHVYLQDYSSAFSNTATKKMTFTGSAGAALDLEANGDNTYTKIYSDILSFAGGAVTLRDTGTTNHIAVLASPDATTAGSTLTINSTGAFLLDASGKGGAGGTVTVNVGTATINSPTFTLNSNSGVGSNANAGSINLSVASFAAASTNTTNIDATGDGTGAGGNVTITSGSTIDLSTSFIVTDGGISGAGGPVSITSTSGDIAGTADISAYGGCSDGNGADVTLSANNVSFANIGASSGGDPATGSCAAVAAQPASAKSSKGGK